MSLSATLYWQEKCYDAVAKKQSQFKEIKRLHKIIEDFKATETKTQVMLRESQDLLAQYSQQFKTMQAKEKQLQQQTNLLDTHNRTLETHILALNAQIYTLEAQLNKICNPCQFCGAGVVTTCRMECANSHDFCNSFLNV